MSDVVVAAQGLTKRYRMPARRGAGAGEVLALENLTLDIHRGEIFALLGPNGAGKTTFISIVAGLVKKSGGEVTVLGHDVERDYMITRRAIGLVPQEINFDPFFSVAEVLRFQRGYFGLPRDEARLEELLRALDLWGKRDANTRMLSGGMKRRLLIAKALVHDPPIVFLDEPTAGVDVSLRRDLWEYVRRRRAQGTTFILTTHYLEEAEQLADRIGVIDRGRLLLVEETARLLDRLGRRRLTVELKRPIEAPPACLAEHGVQVEEGGTRLVFIYPAGGSAGGAADSATAIPSILEGIVRSGLQIRDLSVERPSLEQIFIDLIAKGPAA